MSSENCYLVYTGGLQKLEAINTGDVNRIVHNIPVADQFLSVNLKAGKSFEELKFITETAYFKIVSDTVGGQPFYRTELFADFTGMETFATTHKLMIGEWLLKVTDNTGRIWLIGSVEKGGRFRKMIESKNNGLSQSSSALSYVVSTALPPLKNQ